MWEANREDAREYLRGYSVRGVEFAPSHFYVFINFNRDQYFIFAPGTSGVRGCFCKFAPHPPVLFIRVGPSRDSPLVPFRYIFQGNYVITYGRASYAVLASIMNSLRWICVHVRWKNIDLPIHTVYLALSRQTLLCFLQ